MKVNREIFPLDFKYHQKTQILEVLYADGSVTRFYNIDPCSAFLEDTNERRNYDFFNFLEFRRAHILSCPKPDCDCPSNLTSEIIRGPQTRPNFVSQQTASWTRQWGHK